jgi:hypothetical protein
LKREEVKEVFKILKNVYPQFEVTSEKLDVWSSFLKDQNPAVIMRNTERHVLESKFAPTIADLREVYHPSYNNNVLEQMKQWEMEASEK